MTRSMTAFGRLSKRIQGKNYTFEITSYNRKGLEVHLSIPKELSFLEIPLRKKIAETTSRGHVLLRLLPSTEVDSRLTVARCAEVQKRLSLLAGKLDPSYKVSFETVLSWAKEEASIEGEETLLQSQVEKGVEELLPFWIAMKEREGTMLLKQMQESLALLQRNIDEISLLVPHLSQKIEAKLVERVALVKNVTAEDRERILREVVLYAEKMDISEEITRLLAHMQQLSLLLYKDEGGSKGRMIDFLVQEMLRETNTLSAKTGEIAIIQKALLMKQEIEKIREQGQNIE